MSTDVQFNISHVLQGLVLAGMIWVGSSIQELNTTVQVNDWRLDQLEQQQKARK